MSSRTWTPRTACAELGYGRWRHLLDEPALHSMPSRPQTVFRAKLAAKAVDLRDPQHGGCCAVLNPYAFARPSPLEQQTWMLSVSRDGVVWQRTHTLAPEEHEFPAALWVTRT